MWKTLKHGNKQNVSFWLETKLSKFLVTEQMSEKNFLSPKQSFCDQNNDSTEVQQTRLLLFRRAPIDRSVTQMPFGHLSMGSLHTTFERENVNLNIEFIFCMP